MPINGGRKDTVKWKKTSLSQIQQAAQKQHTVYLGRAEQGTQVAAPPSHAAPKPPSPPATPPPPAAWISIRRYARARRRCWLSGPRWLPGWLLVAGVRLPGAVISGPLRQ